MEESRLRKAEEEKRRAESRVGEERAKSQRYALEVLALQRRLLREKKTNIRLERSTYTAGLFHPTSLEGEEPLHPYIKPCPPSPPRPSSPLPSLTPLMVRVSLSPLPLFKSQLCFFEEGEIFFVFQPRSSAAKVFRDCFPATWTRLKRNSQ